MQKKPNRKRKQYQFTMSDNTRGILEKLATHFDENMSVTLEILLHEEYALLKHKGKI